MQEFKPDNEFEIPAEPVAEPSAEPSYEESVDTTEQQDTQFEEHSIEYQSEAEPSEPSPAVAVDLSIKAPKYKNNSLKTFLIVLAVFLSISLIISCGYFLSNRENGVSGLGFKTELADRPGNGSPNTAQQVYAEASPSVVGIMVYDATGNSSVSQASGVVYSEDGYIVTNDHIYADIPQAKFKICTSNGDIYDAKYIAGDARSDLAILKTDAPNLKKATFAKSEDLSVGEEVIAIGYPAGIYEKSIMTSGTISSVGRRVTSSKTSYSIRLVQTDTAINPGNSGGALLNMYGQVTGITSSKVVGEDYDRIGFAIPSDMVVKVADSLINYGHVEGRARIGITYTMIDLVTAEVNNCPTGLMVVSVSEESDLYNKNISQDDIITHINDVELTSNIIALDIIDGSAPGDVLSLTVYNVRTKTTRTVNATVLNDAGSSSYNENAKTNNSASSGTSSGTFDFPFGD